MKLIFSILVALFLVGCCDTCSDDVPNINCNTIWLGTEHLDTTLVHLSPYRQNRQLTYISKFGDTVNYVQTSWETDTFPIKPCDSSYYNESISTYYQSTSLSPFLRLLVSTTTNSITLGTNFQTSYNLDSMFVQTNYDLSYSPVSDTFDTYFENVFDIYKQVPNGNDIDHIVLDSNHNILAYFQGSKNYWILQ